jgi:hypothetical protein
MAVGPGDSASHSHQPHHPGCRHASHGKGVRVNEDLQPLIQRLPHDQAEAWYQGEGRWPVELAAPTARPTQDGTLTLG